MCEFLDVPVPDRPYPQVNEAKELKRVVLLLMRFKWLPWILLVLYLISLMG